MNNGNINPARKQSFYLQAGFVEIFLKKRLAFPNLKSALKHIFSDAKENMIMLRNDIPVCFSYQHDLPILIPEIICLLHLLQNNNRIEHHTFRICTRDIKAIWVFDLLDDVISIDMNWSLVRGQYHMALNVFSPVILPKSTFINEWLIILKQSRKCLLDTESILTDSGFSEEKLLEDVIAETQGFGSLYQFLKS